MKHTYYRIILRQKASKWIALYPDTLIDYKTRGAARLVIKAWLKDRPIWFDDMEEIDIVKYEVTVKNRTVSRFVVG